MLDEQNSEVWLRGEWPRRRYFVEDGYIKPVPNSQLGLYDPFARFRVEETKKEPDPTDHLVQHLANLDTGDLQAIEVFTSKWGILGLFQHDLYQVRYVPSADGAVQPAHDPPLWAGLKLEEIWEGPDFRVRQINDLEFDPLDVPRDAVEQVLAARGLSLVADRAAWESAAGEARVKAEAAWKADRNKRGAVITRGPLDGYREVALLDYFGRFLPDLSGWPDIPEPADAEAEGIPLLFPSLHSPVLWNFLCEPLDDFRSAVSEFQWLSRLCVEWCEGKQDQLTGKRLRSTFMRHLRRSHPALEWLDSRGERPSTKTGARHGRFGAWLAGWSFPSLLSAAYLMLLFDFTQMVPRLCKNTACRKLFVAANDKRAYCSSRCANQQKQRDFYTRDKRKTDRDREGS